MKIFFAILFMSASAIAGECRIIGITLAQSRLQTSFTVESIQACRNLAIRRNKDDFFGLVPVGDELVETKINFFTDETKEQEVYQREI